jgi:hypothetical protein
MQKLAETRENRDLVSPHLCDDLLSAGIPNIHKLHWLMDKNGNWKLWSYQFDPEGVYEDSDKLIHAINPESKPLRAIQAFSTGDLLAALPPILITSTSTEDYEVGVDLMYGLLSQKDSRLPDALAKLLLDLLNRNVYKVDYVTEKIMMS